MRNQKISRRSFLKRFTYGLLGTLGLSGGTYYYSKYIEPSMLTIKEETIQSPRVPSSFNQFKILQFSDTHLGFHYDLTKLRDLVKKINDQTPDLVLFTGDLADDPNSYSSAQLEACIPILKDIKAPYGKYWVYGNHDHGGYGTEKIQMVMDSGGFQLLQNQSADIPLKDARIQLAGLDDVMLGQPDLHQTLEGTDPDKFTLLMCHEPDFADQTLRYPVDVQLSAHSHGGQIQIPFFGHLITPPYANKYVEGKFTLGDQQLQLFVSRGIGTTRLPFRFLCRPEINIYYLEKLENV
ncbi:metallophosphoesterase [Salinibacillus aidingensis]|uniref:Metallophosphoesterase n=1 Tax=Salinibacillus aidingensis TaxID=237684 RepID=A0ABN1BC55_9BACI